MNSKYNHPYKRLQAYKYFSANSDNHSVFTDVTEGCTIRLLSLVLDIPIKIIRSDIATIMYYSPEDYLEFIDFSKAEIPYYIEYVNSLLEESKLCPITSNDLNYDEDFFNISDRDEYKEYILSGRHDDYPFRFYDLEETIMALPLTVLEFQAYHHLMNKPDSSDKMPVAVEYRDNYLRIKDDDLVTNYAGLSAFISDMKTYINSYSIISFRYKSQNGGFFASTFPVKLLYDSFENAYALLGITDGLPYTYRFERIKGKISVVKKLSPAEYNEYDTSFLEYAPQVWGFEFGAEPINVKIKIYNEANVIRKVRLDLACRTMGKLYEENGAYYYEDVVYGYNSFKKWVRTYGSSIIVIKPESLRTEMIQTLKEML